jgi:hypothetical protein
MTKRCHRCGSPLECYDSELYCQDCCAYVLADEVALTDHEASVLQVLDVPPDVPALLRQPGQDEPGAAPEVKGLADRPRRAQRGTGAV